MSAQSSARRADCPQYIELGVTSAFSFLQGSSLPEELITRASELEMSAIALGDRDGLYGIPRFHMEAKRRGVRAIVGASLCLEDGRRVRVMVESQRGYKNLSRLLTESHFDQNGHSARHSLAEGTSPRSARLADLPKGESRVTWEMLESHSVDLVALAQDDLDRLAAIFPGRLYVEIGRHLDPDEERRNRKLLDEARGRKLPVVATNDVHYAKAEQSDMQDVLTCIREKCTLDQAGRRLYGNAERHLKSAVEMRRLFYDLPDALDNTMVIAERCRFTLGDLGYRFPEYPVPDGGDEMTYLRQLAWEGARRRYRKISPAVEQQISRELDLIARLELAGYFLIVWDLVEHCRCNGILVQGRGSAANSAVCYSLGITAVDPIGMELLFERFLSEERGEWPDIDLDLPSGDQRERVIQYVYGKYGARGCAMTANCITYRSRSAVREVGKALGFSVEQIDRITKRIGHFEFRSDHDQLVNHAGGSGLDLEDGRVRQLIRLSAQAQGLPRHLGQHSGGMVICAGRLDEVVPLEPATMPGRVVVQWDKEDCADLGIIKIDLLGLGMMAVLEEAVPLVKQHENVDVDLAHLPPGDPAVYRMLCEADTVGVFQVESRAQMATLPRMKPERFYDIVVEVAIIRPGPIVGQMVHPYLSRRAGKQEIRYSHPSLEPILKRTLGVPLFQEQLMRIAMVAAGFSGGQAEELRRAMGAKRSVERMAQLEEELRRGMTENGIKPSSQEEIVLSIKSFAQYGFPESHAASFALLVYASTYLKAHHPGAFFAAMLNNWPMGFYHPATLINDARRHGVRVAPIDVTRSEWKCTLEEPRLLRMGLKYVAGMKEMSAVRLVAARNERPFSSVDDLYRRSGATRAEMNTLASLGSLNALGYHRRSALWHTSELGRHGDDLFAKIERPPEEIGLACMSMPERIAADFEASGVTTGPHPMTTVRRQLERRGVTPAADLTAMRDGERATIAGTVIVRQRPGTAKGFFFITLEDETGFSNAIVTPKRFEAERSLLSTAPALIIEGKLQNQDGVVSIKADRFWPLSVKCAASHDFH